MADDRVSAAARLLADQRLRIHLDKVRDLAGRGNIPAARLVADDVLSDLDDIQRTLSEIEGAAPSPAGTGQPYCIWCGLAVSPNRVGGNLVHDAMADSAVGQDHEVELGWRTAEGPS